MESTQWNFDVEKSLLTLAFKDPLIENTYRSIRESKVIAYYPKLFVFFISLVVVLRRVMLVVESYYDMEGLRSCREVPLLIVALITFILETIALYVNGFSKLRCTFLIVCSFYFSADSSITYYISRVKDEPVYAFG